MEHERPEVSGSLDPDLWRIGPASLGAQPIVELLREILRNQPERHRFLAESKRHMKFQADVGFTSQYRIETRVIFDGLCSQLADGLVLTWLTGTWNLPEGGF